MKTRSFRLLPGQDLRKEIDVYVEKHNIKAGVILTCVGNLQKAVLRMANAEITKTFHDSYEIVSLVGTVEKGNSHLHIALADMHGNVIGGHLKNGSIVGFTAEVVIGELEDTLFSRKHDAQTGFEELIVENHHSRDH